MAGGRSEIMREEKSEETGRRGRSEKDRGDVLRFPLAMEEGAAGGTCLHLPVDQRAFPQSHQKHLLWGIIPSSNACQ